MDSESTKDGTTELEQQLAAIQNERASGLSADGLGHDSVDDEILSSLPEVEGRNLHAEQGLSGNDQDEPGASTTKKDDKAASVTKSPSAKKASFFSLSYVFAALFLSLIVTLLFFWGRLNIPIFNGGESTPSVRNIYISAPQLEQYLREFKSEFLAEHDNRHDAGAVNAMFETLQTSMQAQLRVNKELVTKLDSISALLQRANPALTNHQPTYTPEDVRDTDLTIVTSNLERLSHNLESILPIQQKANELSADLAENNRLMLNLSNELKAFRRQEQTPITQAPTTPLQQIVIGKPARTSSKGVGQTLRKAKKWKLNLVSKKFAQAINVSTKQTLRLSIGVIVPDCGAVVGINVSERHVVTKQCVISSSP